MPQFPCSVCSKNVHEKHHAICCDICDQWVHIRSNLLNEKYYTEMKNDPNKVFYCISCINNNMPFTKLSDPICKKGVILSDEVIENDQLSALNCQNYLDKLNSYIANSNSQNDNEDKNYSLFTK